MGSTCPANEKGIKRKAVVYVYVRLGERKKIGLPSSCDDAIDEAYCS